MHPVNCRTLNRLGQIWVWLSGMNTTRYDTSEIYSTRTHSEQPQESWGTCYHLGCPSKPFSSASFRLLLTASYFIREWKRCCVYCLEQKFLSQVTVKELTKHETGWKACQLPAGIMVWVVLVVSPCLSVSLSSILPSPETKPNQATQSGLETVTLQSLPPKC